MVLMTCPGADIAKRLFVNKSSSLWLLYSLKVNKHSVRKKKSKKTKKKTYTWAMAQKESASRVSITVVLVYYCGGRGHRS